jgi:chromosome segregation protein
MQLKSLELTGFKSFVGARIDFPAGVTAIVGPNGTGKSNVVDSILWVLGEQSTKTLRSECMEDVIFNGTESRKPLGLAEASLVIGGFTDEALQGLLGSTVPITGSHDIMITRRLYRNGDSEYLINKTPCRLKDIRSLLLETRAGMKGHTIIEQGRIDQILNASPQDRRELIEETAGIIRYKKQKAEALRKMESTRDNLSRVRDIINEVQRQLNSLQRQARQARTYATLQQEARTLEVRLLVRSQRALSDRMASAEGELVALADQESVDTAEQARLHAAVEERRLARQQQEAAVLLVQEELSRLHQQQAQAAADQQIVANRIGLLQDQRTRGRSEWTRLESDTALADEQIAMLRDKVASAEAQASELAEKLCQQEGRLKQLTDHRAVISVQAEQARRDVHDLAIQVVSGDNAVASMEARLAEGARRSERLVNELAAAEESRVETQERLEEATRQLATAQQDFQNLQERRQSASLAVLGLEEGLQLLDAEVARRTAEAAATESRLHTLTGVLREDMGYGREGEQTQSLRVVCKGVGEAVPEWLDVPAGLERAIEAVLGDRVRAWMVEDPRQARDAIAYLTQHAMGRGAFVPQSLRWANQADPETWWSEIYGQPGVLGRAVDLLGVKGAPKEALACLFHGVVVVEQLDTALSLWCRGNWTGPIGPTFVSLEGDVLDPSGVVIGGTISASGGILQRKREIADLQQAHGALTAAIAQEQAQRGQAVRNLETARAHVGHLDEQLRGAELRAATLAKDVVNLQELLASLGQRRDTFVHERQAAEDERTRMEAELQQVRVKLAQLIQTKAGNEATLTQVNLALHQVGEEYQVLDHEVADLRLALGMMTKEREHWERDLSRQTQEQQQRAERLERLRVELDEQETAIQEGQAERDRYERTFLELDRQQGQVRDRLTALHDELAAHQAQLATLDENLDVVRGRLTAIQQARTDAEVRRAEIRTKLADLELTLSGTYKLSTDEAAALDPIPQADLLEPAPIPTDDELREQLQKVRDRLDRMGPINQAAISECEELEQRHQFLTTQEADLSNSIESLREIITRINRTTRQMFDETFQQLQERFGEVFGRFFPGGRAELVLVEPEAQAEGSELPASDEPGVDIVAQPPGKRLKSISMLSGGEKTLTAMALIFASFLIRPTPFCILDEIDAPLDEENIGRFTTVLQELAHEAQFLVITHNKRTMSVADSLFGVTMEEPGVSKLVSVRLADLQPA